MQRARLVGTRFVSARNRQSATVWTTSGLTLAALTSRIARSFKKRLTPCFAGTKMQRGVMSIS